MGFKKIEIANKVKTDLTNLKAILPFTMARNNSGDISFDNQKINEYYNVSNVIPNKVAVFSAPKNTEDIIANINARKLNSEPIEGGNPGEPIEVSPHVVLIAEGYRKQYWDATEGYQDLESYLVQLTNIGSDLTASVYVSDDEKTMMYFEIEILKQYANELETNPDYWINLYAPAFEEPMTTSYVKTNSVMAVGDVAINSKVIMSGNPPKKGCKISTRDVLAGAIVGGFSTAIFGVKAGAVAGTFTVPGFGTVTGAVSGFMAGFAVGFTGGIVAGVIASAITCRPR